METTKKNLAQKLMDFQKKVTVIKKDAKNPHFKNTYASLSQILGEVKPILSECDLILLQTIDEKGCGTTVMDLEGSKIESFIPLPTNLTPQQMGSAITYYRRYSLASLLALEIDDDDAQSTNVTKAPEFVDTTSDKKFLNKVKFGTTEITPEWEKVIKAIGGHDYTIAQVESKYKLSKELKAELIQIQQNGI